MSDTIVMQLTQEGLVSSLIFLKQSGSYGQKSEVFGLYCKYRGNTKNKNKLNTKIYFYFLSYRKGWPK